MKTLLKNQVFALALLCMYGACAKAETTTTTTTTTTTQNDPKKEQDYTSPTDLMRDFLDLTKKPQEKIQYWTRQFLLLFQKDPKLKDFCKELVQAVRFKNVNRIGSLFIVYQQQFSAELRGHLLSKGIPVVKKILEERVKK